MKLVIIFGPQAVGKMTVGQELEKITNLKLFHNHMTIELVSNYFSYGTPTGKRLVKLFREEIFKEVVNSDLEGLIFTYLWYFDYKDDQYYIEKVAEIFRKKRAEIYYVELEADIEERIKRNKTEHRLEHKPTKRDITWSENEVRNSEIKHRANSIEGEIKEKNYIRINNTKIDATSVAVLIKKKFNL
ncbi:MAG TPA: AAA family ATPase [Patescibacteria group bacterium]|nr:AAA family ATPase [Patescibacteria group bacterium]